MLEKDLHFQVNHFWDPEELKGSHQAVGWVVREDSSSGAPISFGCEDISGTTARLSLQLEASFIQPVSLSLRCSLNYYALGALSDIC